MSLRILLAAALVTLLPLSSAAHTSRDGDVGVDEAWLAPADESVSSRPIAGHPFLFEGRIVNHGPHHAGAQSVWFVLDGSNYDVAPVPALAPGASVLVQSQAWTATSGLHRLEVRLATLHLLDASRSDDAIVLTFTPEDEVLRVVAASAMAHVRPFASASHDVTVTNMDDGPHLVRLAHTGAAPGWTAGLDRTEITLAPGQSTTVHLTVVARPGGAPLETMLHVVPVAAAAARVDVVLSTGLAP